MCVLNAPTNWALFGKTPLSRVAQVLYTRFSHSYCNIVYRRFSTVGTTAEANRLSIHSILQQPAVPHASTMNFVVITDLVSLSCVQGFAADIAKASFTKATPVYMPIL